MNFMHSFRGLTAFLEASSTFSSEQMTEAVSEAVETTAGTSALTAEQVTETVTEAVTEIANGGFHPEEFINNLKYMGAGMIGIFLVIGVIILTILILGKLTAPKNQDSDE